MTQAEPAIIVDNYTLIAIQSLPIRTFIIGFFLAMIEFFHTTLTIDTEGCLIYDGEEIDFDGHDNFMQFSLL